MRDFLCHEGRKCIFIHLIQESLKEVIALGGMKKYIFLFSYDNLAEAEQFALSLADIKRLVPRLKSLK